MFGGSKNIVLPLRPLSQGGCLKKQTPTKKNQKKIKKSLVV
jgi:hypothetical protein